MHCSRTPFVQTTVPAALVWIDIQAVSTWHIRPGVQCLPSYPSWEASPMRSLSQL